MAGETKTDKGKHAGKALLFSPCGGDLACLCSLSQQNPMIPRFANRDKRSQPAPCITNVGVCLFGGLEANMWCI